MALKLHLHAGDAADYQWGSLLARFMPTAKVTSRTLMESLVGLMQGTGMWKTEPEFRRTIAFMHEFVHYGQDLLTGVGHWDYLVQNKYLPKILGEALFMSWIPQVKPPYDRPEADPAGEEDTVRAYLDEILFVPTHKLSPQRRARLFDAARRLPDYQIVEDDNSLPCFIENLFEAEAAVTVFDIYFSLKRMASAESEEIARQNRSLFYPGYMKEQYWDAFQFFRTSLGLEGANVADRKKFFHAVCWMFIFFVDLACAHPSPRLLEKMGEDRIAYEPGIKFMRLVRAFKMMDGAADSAFMNRINARDVWGAEKILLDNCDYGYRASREVYEDWAGLFGEMLKEDDDRVVRMREGCCRRRLSDPVYCISKNTSLAVSQQIPVLVLTPPGFVFYGVNESILPEEQDIVRADILRRERDMEVASYYFETGRLVCPLAEAKMCGAATPDCLSGLTDLGRTPPADKCGLRRSLEKSNFNLDL